MARRKSASEEGISLFPFMSILACLIGILTLMISVISQIKETDTEGLTDEERASAVTRRNLVSATRKVEKEIVELDQRMKTERATATELEKLKDRRIVLREKLDGLSKAENQSDAELQKIAENLKLEIAALRKDRPTLVKRIEELQKLIKDRREAPEPPKSVQVRPAGSGLRAASNIFFVECHSTGINILEKGQEPTRITKSAIPSSGEYSAFLAKVKGTRDSMVLYLIRKAGNESYLWAAAEARTKFELNTGKLPLPNDGPLDLSLFD